MFVRNERVACILSPMAVGLGALLVCASTTLAQPVNTGGCCLPTNVGCEQTTPDICEAAGGEYEGGSCFQAACHIQFADCCRPEGFCSNATFQTCFNDFKGGWIPAGCNEPDNCDDNDTCCEDMGACCHSGICEDLSLEECNERPFGMYVPGYTCEDAWYCTDPEGPCCFQQEGCLFLHQTNCQMMGGTFMDLDAGCDDIDIIDCSIRSGACCLDDGQCVDTIPTDCQGSDGQYQGDGSTCAFINFCPQPGACCDPYGDCWETIAENCYEGQDELFQGEGTTCDDLVCAYRAGACCDHFGPDDVECYDETTYFGCGGTYFGDETLCEDIDCAESPDVGACCLFDGQCQVVTEEDCNIRGGAYQGDYYVCEEVECTAIEACCFVDSSCVNQSAADCEAQGGIAKGPGTNCATDACPELGRCCTTDGGCETTDIDSCFSQFDGFSFGYGITCESYPCPPVGACCTETGCISRSAGACEAYDGQHYLGDGTDCAAIDCAACPGEGDCLTAHASGGCEEPTCCQSVCTADATCCSDAWSPACVDLANTLCTIPVAFGPTVNPETCHRYYVLQSSTWRFAELTARSLGGHLAAIGDADEDTWVVSEVVNVGGSPKNLWLGLNDVDMEGTFAWSNGEPTAYTNWGDGEPDNLGGPAGADFVQLRSFDGKWHDTVNTAGGTYGAVEVPPGPGNGDSTGDCAVTLDDFVELQPCLNAGGPGVPVAPDCLGPFDSDGDGDIDLWDGAQFQLHYEAP